MSARDRSLPQSTKRRRALDDRCRAIQTDRRNGSSSHNEIDLRRLARPTAGAGFGWLWRSRDALVFAVSLAQAKPAARRPTPEAGQEAAIIRLWNGSGSLSEYSAGKMIS